MTTTYDTLRRPAWCAAAAALASLAALPAPARAGGYDQVNLVSNDVSRYPALMEDPLLQNPWGVSLRPPGAGGHFWVANAGSGTTTTYVGDANGVPLFQDGLKVVDIAKSDVRYADGRPRAPVPGTTGTVYNHSSTDFLVSGEGMAAASKFIFCTAEGTISGWTEVPDPTPADPGNKRRQTVTVTTVDKSAAYDDEVLQYTGLAVTEFASGNRLYAAQFARKTIDVFDGQWKPVTMAAGTAAFRYPGMPDDYTPWNVQFLRRTPSDPGSLFVAYAQVEEPWEELSAPGAGAVAEFDLEGRLIRTYDQSIKTNGLSNGELNAPWGLAIAPADFGPLSRALLVANFGDGTISGFDVATGQFIDFMRGPDGEPIAIDGIWGLTFGNGVGLGDADALYFTAGPNNELDGVFGALRVNAVPEPASAGLLAAAAAAALGRRRRPSSR